MATFKSDIYTTQSAVNSNNRADGRLVAGKVRQATASYTLINTESAADTINLVELPTGCLIDPSRSFLQVENPGTTLTVDVGFPSNTDSLTPTILTVSAGGKFMLDEAGAASLVTVAAGDELISITVVSEASLTAGQVIRAVITYVDYN